MDIIACVIFVSLVIGVNCTQRKVQFAKDTALSGFTCSAAEQIGDVVLTQTIEMCTSVCPSTDGCNSVFHTRSGYVRCRSQYRKASDARLLPMAGSVSYTTGIVKDAICYIVCIVRFFASIVIMGTLLLDLCLDI
ncbi:hypothetical protein DPMN_146140 [Dreissena polymorpha]|uniref:Apple domain-containing protein n=1 Tax=Dreissena polymorpha TaxID=45954 RepID=A0A9D4F825_DREPO|nr:hypothetical protein DPMN_146140 [Dreissena polymorpha]